MDDTDSREQGVEFGSLLDALEGADYPLSHEELLDEYGDHELGLEDGETTLEAALDAENEREYEDPEAVEQAVLDMVGEDAVGREGETDRGGSSPGIEDEGEDVSF